MNNEKDKELEALLEGKTIEQKKVILETKHMIAYHRDVFIYCCGLSKEEADREIENSIKRVLKDKRLLDT